MDETAIAAKLHQWQTEGKKSRDDGTACPYPGGTVAHAMHAAGWLVRDLQLALCAADPVYRANQVRFGNVPDGAA